MKKIFFLLVALIILVPISFASAKVGKAAEKKKTISSPLKKGGEVFDFKKVEIDQFIDPAVCGACHTDIYSQWSGSMHTPLESSYKALL